MTPIPIHIVLFTSTQGHFKTSRYLETLDHLSAQIPLSQFAGLIAHVKVSPDQDSVADEMVETLEKRGFEVMTTHGEWSHGKNHGVEYVADLIRMYTWPSVVSAQYVLHLEDDWLLTPQRGELLDHLSQAVTLLEQQPFVHSVRFARWFNECERINDLPRKHGLNAHCVPLNETFDLSSDFSLNPHIARARSMYHACLLMSRATNGQPHPEHSLGAALKFLNTTDTIFAHFKPELISARHIGCDRGLEDPLDQPIYATL
jgi:hypothetical protein